MSPRPEPPDGRRVPPETANTAHFLYRRARAAGVLTMFAAVSVLLCNGAIAFVAAQAAYMDEKGQFLTGEHAWLRTLSVLQIVTLVALIGAVLYWRSARGRSRRYVKPPMA